MAAKGERDSVAAPVLQRLRFADVLLARGHGRCAPEVIDVALASLHGDIDRLPQAHYFYDSKASWTDVRDELPKLGGPTGTEPLQAME